MRYDCHGHAAYHHMIRDTIVLILALVALLILGVFINMYKPTCRDGYVAYFGLEDGWICISGYKPQ